MCLAERRAVGCGDMSCLNVGRTHGPRFKHVADGALALLRAVRPPRCQADSEGRAGRQGLEGVLHKADLTGLKALGHPPAVVGQIMDLVR